MKVAIIGSRSLTVQNLGEYLPQGVTEIVSGGAKGIDACAREYAHQAGLKLTEFCRNIKGMAVAHHCGGTWRSSIMQTK